MEITLEQRANCNRLLDKLINDVVEGCALKCDERAKEWACIHAEAGGSAGARGEEAASCATVIRELKW